MVSQLCFYNNLLDFFQTCEATETEAINESGFKVSLNETKLFFLTNRLTSLFRDKGSVLIALKAN